MGIDVDFHPARRLALEKAEECGAPGGALILPDGQIVTGKTSDLLGAASSVLINAMKRLANIPDETYIISDEALEPICKLKTDHLGAHNPRLHPEEMLIALSISSLISPLASKAIDHCDLLKGCDAFFSNIMSADDERLYKTLGINVCCEPVYASDRRYHR